MTVYVILCRAQGPVDAEHLRSLLVENACDRAEEKLQINWYPQVIGMFNKNTSTASASAPASFRITNSHFYESVHTLIGNQLRSMLSLTIQRYVQLFDADNTTHLPQFKLQLCLEGHCMEFFPSVSELESAVVYLVDVVSNSMSNLSTIEVHTHVHVHVHACQCNILQGWLSGANPCPSIVVGVDPTLVLNASATLKQALHRNLKGPLEHLQLYSECLARLLCMCLIHDHCFCREVQPSHNRGGKGGCGELSE